MIKSLQLVFVRPRKKALLPCKHMFSISEKFKLCWWSSSPQKYSQSPYFSLDIDINNNVIDTKDDNFVSSNKLSRPSFLEQVNNNDAQQKYQTLSNRSKALSAGSV